MSLVYDTLKSDLLDAFNNMGDGDDDYFAEQVAKAVKTYIETGGVTTVDTGTVSAGVFTGTGSGDMEVESDDCEDSLSETCSKMRDMTSGGGDAYLAAQMASAINTMVLDGTVKTDVSGTAVAGSVSTPLTGKAEGTLTGVAATIQSALVSIFSKMQNMTSGGDEYFAEQMAIAVNSYLLAGVVATNGKNALSGSVGTGNMT